MSEEKLPPSSSAEVPRPRMPGPVPEGDGGVSVNDDSKSTSVDAAKATPRAIPQSSDLFVPPTIRPVITVQESLTTFVVDV